MPLKTFKPNTPSTRQLVIVERSGLHKGKPVKSLTRGLTKKAGRKVAKDAVPLGARRKVLAEYSRW